MIANKNKMKTGSNFSRELIKGVVEAFFLHGDLTEEDLKQSPKAILEKTLNILKSSELVFVSDHRENIVKQAEIFVNLKEINYAKIFFAMFFEHSLNSIITFECKKRGVNDKTKIDIIRSIDIGGKLTWLLILLGHKEFNTAHLKTIKKLSEDRNSFIHYKWKPDDDSVEEDETKILNEIKRIKSAVNYMKKYEARILFRKNKGKLSNALRGKSN